MPEFTIIPADDPRVMCVFNVPRKGSSPITFAVPRMEFTPQSASKKFDAWLRERSAPVPVLDKDGDPVMDDLGAPKMESPEFLGDREVTLKALELAGGVARSKISQLEKLTDGELDQIWRFWRDESKVTLGESEASANS